MEADPSGIIWTVQEVSGLVFEASKLNPGKNDDRSENAIVLEVTTGAGEPGNTGAAGTPDGVVTDMMNGIDEPYSLEQITTTEYKVLATRFDPT